MAFSQSWQVKLKEMGRVRCEPGWQFTDKPIYDMDLWFVWSGTGQMLLCESQQQVDLRPGICIWMKPGKHYTAKQDPLDRLGVTFIHFDFIQRTGPHASLPIRDNLPDDVLDFPDVLYADTLLKRVVQLCTPTPCPGGLPSLSTASPSQLTTPASPGILPHPGTPPGTPPGAPPGTDPGADPARQTAALLFTGFLDDLLANWHRPDQDDLPKAVSRYHRDTMLSLAASLREEPATLPTVSELAKQAGYSPDHFTRVFKAVLGLGPHAYMAQVRVDRAKQLLDESSMSVGQIADALHYGDVFFFSRQFKQKTGVSPRAYRGRERNRG